MEGVLAQLPVGTGECRHRKRGATRGREVWPDTRRIAGVVLMFVGAVWFLQDIKVLPGSFMTGQTKWAVIGGATFSAGAVILVFASRRRRATRGQAQFI